MSFDVHYNKDFSFFRSAIVGILSKLNGLYWYNQIGQNINDIKKIHIPFYLSTTGSERYLYDNFINNITTDKDDIKAETYYNQIPRGIVEISGISVNSSSITNKYIRTEHVVQEKNGSLNTYNSETFYIPFILNLDVSIFVDSMLDQFKATELIFKAFYKKLKFSFEYNNNMIDGYIVFSDDVNMEHLTEFSFTEKKEHKITFSIESHFNMPVYREEHESLFNINPDDIKTSRFHVGNKMVDLINNVETGSL